MATLSNIIFDRMYTNKEILLIYLLLKDDKY